MKTDKSSAFATILSLLALTGNALALEPTKNLSKAVVSQSKPMLPGAPGDAPGGTATRSDTCPATNVGVLSDGSTILGSTIGSADDFVPICFSPGGGRDEIFEFSVDICGEWTFDTCTVPACWDTTLEIRQETGGGCPGVFVACDSGSCNVCYFEAQVSFFLETGTPYYLVVDGFTSGAYGDFTITAARLQEPCCNDDAACDDGVFCNGSETCDLVALECLAGPPPCPPAYTCDEATQMCIPPPPPAPEPHMTLQGSQTRITFGAPDVPKIPADFFFPGSQQRNLSVTLSGGVTDTLGQRSDQIDCPGAGFPRSCNPVAVELVHLDLVSRGPIDVDATQWDVAVSLSPTGNPPLGTLAALLTHANGGTYDADIPLAPRFAFTELGNSGNVRILDYGIEGLPPIIINFLGVDWIVVLGPVLVDTIPAPNDGDFVPGVREVNPGDPNSQVVIQSLGLSNGLGVRHLIQPPSTDCPVDPIFGDCILLQHRDCGDGQDNQLCKPREVVIAPGGAEANVCDCFVDPGLECREVEISDDGDTVRCVAICDGGLVPCNIFADGVSTGSAAVATSQLALGTLVTCECDPVPMEACCFEDGSCFDIELGICSFVPGAAAHGDGTACQGDGDGNGIDDACEVNVPQPVDPGTSNDRRKNRFISFKPNNTAGLTVKLEVTLTVSLPHPGLVSSSWWVQPPVAPGNPLLPPGECVALLGPQATAADIDWTNSGCTVLHVTGCPIEPTSDYEVRAVAGPASDPLVVSTIFQPGVKFWGDVVGFFNGVEWTPPNGTVSIDDLVAVLKTWQGGPVVAPVGNVAHLSVADVERGNINLVVNFNDVLAVNGAFTGNPYPFGPADGDGHCPPP